MNILPWFYTFLEHHISKIILLYSTTLFYYHMMMPLLDPRVPMLLYTTFFEGLLSEYLCLSTQPGRKPSKTIQESAVGPLKPKEGSPGLSGTLQGEEGQCLALCVWVLGHPVALLSGGGGGLLHVLADLHRRSLFLRLLLPLLHHPCQFGGFYPEPLAGRSFQSYKSGVRFEVI